MTEIRRGQPKDIQQILTEVMLGIVEKELDSIKQAQPKRIKDAPTQSYEGSAIGA